MAQREVELILVRQLASYLTTPVLVVDPLGTLLYFNEAAEPYLGRRFEESDELSFVEWAGALAPENAAGVRLQRHEGPLMTALREHRPAQETLSLATLGGERRDVVVTAFPLAGQGGRDLGAVAMLGAPS